MPPSPFAQINAVLHWFLILFWLIILIFYWREYRRLTALSPMVGTMLVVVFLDGARTLLENIYFGVGYTALAGWIPHTLFDILIEQPQNVMAPRMLNLFSALIIIGVLVRRWFPDLAEEMERQRQTEILYAELQAAHEEAQEAQESRDALAHMIVHDMRTPLTNVITGLQTLQQLEETSPLGDELVQGALTGANKLLSMVNDLLDISKMESGEMVLHRERFPVDAVIKDALASVDALARDKQQTLVRDLEAIGAETEVYADREKVRRVLVNLLGNAVKFTPEGGQITVRGERETDGALCLSVIDTGPGIAKEYQEKVFDKFYQVLHGRTKGVASTGLGLTFCKMAVEAMGGKIGLESEPGHGSRFWFTLPAESVDANKERSQEDAILHADPGTDRSL